jgi:hypothetical protein
VPRGQPLKFLLKGNDEVAFRGLLAGIGPESGGLGVTLSPPSLVGAAAKGKAIGDRVKPATQPPTMDQRWRLAQEDEERGLEGIFSAMFVEEYTTARAQDQGSVPAHEVFDGRLVAVGDEPLQELGIRHRRCGDAPNQVANMVQEWLRMGLGHSRVLRASQTCNYPLRGRRQSEQIGIWQKTWAIGTAAVCKCARKLPVVAKHARAPGRIACKFARKSHRAGRARPVRPIVAARFQRAIFARHVGNVPPQLYPLLLRLALQLATAFIGLSA